MTCRIRAAAIALALTALCARGQVTFTLAAKDGKTTFRVGEAVEVEFRFQASQSGEYSVSTLQPVRQVRQPEYDRFEIEPSAPVADPLSDIFAQMSGGSIIGRPPRPEPLAAAPVTIELQVNEWLSIRKPGHYRISAETTRVVTGAEPGTPVPLRSNSIEIDVVAPEPGWAAAQLQQAVAVLQIADPPRPTYGQGIPAGSIEARQADGARAARTLRFLETPDAAMALARYFDHGPLAAQAELHAGLFATPFRNEVIAAMEAAVSAPDVPITYYYIGTLMELVELARFGALPLYAAKSSDEIQRWFQEFEGPYREKAKTVETEYFAKLAEAIGRKQGQALAVSLETLLTRGPQPVSPATVKSLVANFRLLPDFSQPTFLTQQWSRIASPDLVPMLRSMAEGNGKLRDSALLRLQELDPEAARKITLDRIQRADVSREAFRDDRVLLTLPDQTLPNLDNALVEALEQNRPQVETLIARYASDAVLPRLQAWVEQSPQRMCHPVLPAYFFRVDAKWGALALARARQSGRGACAVNLSPNEDLLMSPGLERQAIEDLGSSDPSILRSAHTLLQLAGSAAAEKPLLQAFARLRASGADMADSANRVLEQKFVTAVLNANRWLPSQETFNQATTYCATEECRKQVTSAKTQLEPPLAIDIHSLGAGGFSMGTLTLHVLPQLQDRIALFPKGTPFYLTGNSEASWYDQQRATQVLQVLEGAGMQLVHRPAPGRP